MQPAQSSQPILSSSSNHLERGLGLFDSTMLVAGSMIGSGIFIVSSEMARQIGSPGWLLASWLLTGVLTMAAALSYGELAAMMPRAGGQYVYLRESFSPLLGFLYGWTLFLVIQTGTIAAVGIGFARYLGILWSPISESQYIIPPIRIFSHYAISLSTAQLVAILVIAFLTGNNLLGIRYGKAVQNLFTCAKLTALFGVIVLGLFAGLRTPVLHDNLQHLWAAQNPVDIAPGLSAFSIMGLIVAICVSQTGSLFSSDAWNNITFIAGEVKNPKRNVPLSLFFGASLVIALYLLANVAYLSVLSLAEIQHAPSDRVAGTMLNSIFPALGSAAMAVVIMISAFGCINGLVLSGARAYYAMACDGLFFRAASTLNKAHVPGKALGLQMAWTIFLVLVRTYDPVTSTFGNLYSNLLDYVISAALIFYILTILGVFVLRKKRPHAERPYRAFGYPVVPALYIAGALTILVVLFIYRPATTFPGLLIAALGVPVYWLFRNVNKVKGADQPHS